MPTPPTPPTYWWLTVRIDACRTRDERVAAVSGDDAVRMWRELHPNVEVIHVRPVPELVDIELEHVSTNNNNHDPTTDHDLLSLDELRDLWNAQADAANSWDALGADEIVWWAQRQALARTDLAQQLNGTDPIRGVPPLLADSAALAAEPVAERPTDTQLIEEAIAVGLAFQPQDEVSEVFLPFDAEEPLGELLVNFARAVLARWGHHSPDATKMVSDAYQMGRRDASADSQQAAEAAEGDVAELVAWLRNMANADLGGIDELNADRVADLLEQRHPAPVPVSERLPGPEDCDAEGRCWWWYPPVPEQNYGYWIYEDNAVPERSRLEWPDSWLPATALPLPKEVEK